MKYIALIFSLLLIGCSGNGTDQKKGSRDWGIFRADAQLSGYTPTILPKEPVLRWSFKSDSRTSSSPVVLDGTAYWCDKRGFVRGVDAEGKICFEYDFATAVEATPMIMDSVLYVGRIDGMMCALSLATKDTLWSFETMGQISAAPNQTDFEGRRSILFGSYDHYLYCVDSRSGKEIARYPSGYYINGAVARMGRSVIYGGCDSWVRIIDTQTGIQTDSLLTDAYVPSSPAIIDDYCYVADYSGNIYELKIEQGKIAAKKKIVGSGDHNSSYVAVPAVTREDLYVYSGQTLLAIDRKSGSTRWKYLMKGSAGESSPVVCEDKVLVCSKSGVVTILDVKNGKLLWEYDTGEQITASAAVISDQFYVLSTKGTLFCFNDKAK